MFYKSFIVVFVAMGIRGQPIDKQSLLAVFNKMTAVVSPHGNPVQIVVINGANYDGNIPSSTEQNSDVYQHTPGIGYHKLHTQALDWNSARKSCQDEGGHLAIINSPAEAEVLRKLFANSGEITGTEPQIKDSTNLAWLGIHDLYKEGEWTTIFGDSLSSTGFNKWAEGEPNNVESVEHCGALYRSGKLNDLLCGIPYAYFCELPTNLSKH